jgi:hypothetical protein
VRSPRPLVVEQFDDFQTFFRYLVASNEELLTGD